jgi:hypothetical protein
VKHWFTIYRLDTDSGLARITKHITTDRPYDAWEECNKMNKFVREKHMDHYVWFYKEVDVPPIVVAQ